LQAYLLEKIGEHCAEMGEQAAVGLVTMTKKALYMDFLSYLNDQDSIEAVTLHFATRVDQYLAAQKS